MKYYLKQGVFPFIYMLFMAIIAFGILIISGLLWLKIILAVLNIALYAVVVAAVSYKEGQESVKVQHANDLERMEIIRTGENRPLKVHEEYKPWKGFTFGFAVCVPLIVLLALHTILYLSTGSYRGLGAIAGLVYFMFFVFFTFGAAASAGEAATGAALPWYSFYGALIALPIVMLITGIAYLLGAKKIMRQYEIIQEKQRSIYGDKL
ncbi:MAG: hypothetical protein IJQ87_01730 [Clostridia bacterium]|nr:hypothetical protein [Clostridia bacterium]